jgi:hypothetical protein
MKTFFGRRMWLIVLAVLIVFAALPAAAQDVELTETFTLDDGTTFQYPGDWTLENEKNSFLNVADDQTQLFIIDPVSLEDFGFSSDADLRDALTGYFEDIFAGQIKLDKKKLQDVEIGGREAVRYDYDDPAGDGALLIALRLSDGSIALIDSVSLDGELIEADVVLAIAETLDRTGEAGGADGNATVSTTPCTVTTDSNKVAVRVGPGTNRATFVFLPSGMDFDVLGKAEIDGHTWWKLDKQAVAPKKSAAEAWVSELDVDESGECDTVADVNAPPVIPISAPPAGGNNGGGGGSSGNSGGGGQPAGAGEALPQSGNWTITYPKTVPGSCTNIPTQNLDVDYAPESVSVSGANGSSLVLDGDVFPRIGANTYQGSYVTDEGDPVLLTLRVSSATYMTGEFIISFTQDGAQCSITVTSSITHN